MLVAPGEELQVVHVVVVVARGSQDFKRQVSYDRRGSARTVGGVGLHQPCGLPVVANRRGQFTCFMINPGASFLKNKCRKKHLAMVKTREAVFSKVLTFFGIRHSVPST